MENVLQQFSQMDSNSSMFIVLGVIAAAALFCMIWFITSIIVIGANNRVWVVSGKGERKFVQSGDFAVVLPIIHDAKALDTGSIVHKIEAHDLMSKNGILISLTVTVNVSVGPAYGEPEELSKQIWDNASTRLLGKEKADILRTVNEILEGNLREAVSSLTVEELNENLDAFRAKIHEVSKPDLEATGLRLFSISILDISDRKKYLEKLTAKKLAAIISQQDINEKQYLADTQKLIAENNRRVAVAKAEADQAILDEDVKLNDIKSVLNGKLREEQVKAEQLLKRVKAEGERDIQRANLELQGILARANSVLPAEVQARATQIVAEGEAEKQRIVGETHNKILQRKLEVLRDGGSAAMIPILFEKLEAISKDFQAHMGKTRVQNSLICSDSKNSGYAAAVNMGPEAFLKHLEIIERGTGFSLRDFFRKDSLADAVAVIPEDAPVTTTTENA
jgi:flotillin